MPTETAFDPNDLSDAYEISGELSGRADVRTFLARRRTDGEDVLITVVTTPEGDEGNALSHLAADAKSLMANTHPNIVPVVDARWVGTDAFAIVTPRLAAPTLAELLARREEEFDYPRIATILREVNAALEWSRGQKIVHRAIDPETLHVEQGSDSIVMSFGVRALPLADMPGEEDDARTIATLARTMLTRSAGAPERDALPLAELRPGLPKKVIEQTEAILGAAPRTAPPDISGYIASIAMAEALKRGEVEIEKMAAKWAAEERAMREEIERLRHENERMADEQTRLHAEERATIARDRERMEREYDKKRRELERALDKEREELEHALLQDRKALDEERASLATLREELIAQRNLYADTSQFHAPPATDLPDAPRMSTSVPFRLSSRPRRASTPRRTGWIIPTAVAVLLIVAAGLFAIGNNRLSLSRDSVGGVTVARRADSASGLVSTPDTSALVAPTVQRPPAPAVPADLMAGVATRAATSPPAYEMPVRRRAVPPDSATLFVSPRSEPTRRLADTTTSVVPPADTTRPRLDTARPLLPPSSLTVPTIRVDTLVRPRRDSVRRDTIPRDTLPWGASS